MGTSTPIARPQKENGIDILQRLLERHPGRATKLLFKAREGFEYSQIALSADEIDQYTRLIVGDFIHTWDGYWPPYLIKVTDDLTIHTNSMTSLGYLRTVGGRLSISGTNVANLGDLETAGSLDVRASPLTSWGSIKSVGDIHLSPGQTELIDDFAGSEMRIWGKVYVDDQELLLLRGRDGLIEGPGPLRTPQGRAPLER